MIALPLTTKEMAVRLRVNPQTVRNWANDGLIPCIRKGTRYIRFEEDKVMEAIRKFKKP